MQYSVLSQIYDQLMVNVDYEMWASYIEYLILEQGERPLNILELGCGSGNVTEKLLEKGYEVVGIDYSEEMLEIAEEKTEEFGNKVIYIQQDLREIDFEVYEIEKYNQIWFELEIENSVVISYFENTKRIDKWDENQELILIKLQNMLLFLNEIILK